MKTFMLFAIALMSVVIKSLSADQDLELVRQALQARKNAYAPYSHHYIEAALLASNGKIYNGCNVENGSYGLTNCAERTALFNGVTAGEIEFKTLALVTKTGGLCCGACRQVLNEFNPKLRIITADENGRICHQCTLDELLHFHLDLKILKAASKIDEACL